MDPESGRKRPVLLNHESTAFLGGLFDLSQYRRCLFFKLSFFKPSETEELEAEGTQVPPEPLEISLLTGCPVPPKHLSIQTQKFYITKLEPSTPTNEPQHMTTFSLR